jgi:hypothetical protein
MPIRIDLKLYIYSRGVLYQHVVICDSGIDAIRTVGVRRVGCSR